MLVIIIIIIIDVYINYAVNWMESRCGELMTENCWFSFSFLTELLYITFELTV